ncbi:MAG: PAS domain S-box protein [Thiohalocapsa sp.]|nr:PAS domain S-box protein [Thiohalocapsa sp.]
MQNQLSFLMLDPEIWLAGVSLLGVLVAGLLYVRGARPAHAGAPEGRGLYGAIIDAAPDSLSLVDRNYIYRAVNAEYLRRTGRSREAVEGRSVSEIMGEDVFVHTIKPHLDRALSGERVQYEAWFEYAMLGRRCMLVGYTPFRENADADAVTGVLVSASDITSLRESEQAQREAQVRLEQIVDNSPAIICVKNLEGRILVLNGPGEALLGLKPGSGAGRRCEDLFPETVWEMTEAAENQVVETGTPMTREETLPLPSGTVTLLATRFPLFALDGEPNAVCTIALDVTERKSIEQELTVALAKYRILFNQFPLGITVTDSRGDIRETNSVAERLLGISRAEHVSRTIDHPTWELIRADGSIIPPDAYASVRALKEGRVVREDEMGIRHADGSVTWLSVTAAPLSVPGYGVVITYHDISAHKAALEAQRREASLRESERRFRTMADGLSSAVWVTDSSGTIEFVNQRYVELFGVDPDAVQGSRWRDLVHPDDLQVFVDKIETAMQRRRPFNLQCRARRADGEWRWFGSSARPRFADDGTFIGFVGSSNEITRRKRIEQALRQSRRELKTRSHQLAHLAGELTRAEQRERRRLGKLLHDHLQQLLVGAALSADRVGRRIDGAAVDELTQLKSVLDEAIAASRTLMSDLSPPIVYEVGLAESLHWLSRSMYEKYRLQVRIDADDSVVVEDDVLRVFLFDAVREALFNVVKHAGVSTARVTLRRCGEDEVRIEIADAGSGFEQSDGADRLRPKGLGLLAMRERMLLLGGGLDIDSAASKGTRVTLSARLCPAPEREAAPQLLDTPAAEVASPSSDVTVLLVDDHAVVREGLALLLADEQGIAVVGEAANGQEAVEKARALLPDIVVMDFSMPLMDGVEATRVIHERWPGMAIIGLSLYEQSDRAKAMLAAGAVDYVCKTSVTEELREKIRMYAPVGDARQRRMGPDASMPRTAAGRDT